MNLIFADMLLKNRIVVLAVLLVFSLLTAYMPHGMGEVNENYEHEGLLCHVVNISKPAFIIRKILRKIRVFIQRMVESFLSHSTAAVAAGIRFILACLSFIDISFVFMLSFLYSYFNGGKFKIITEN